MKHKDVDQIEKEIDAYFKQRMKVEKAKERYRKKHHLPDSSPFDLDFVCLYPNTYKEDK